MANRNAGEMKGKKFGKMTVLQFAGINKHRRYLWKCLCECGAMIVVPGNALRSGNTASCGCHNRKKSITHGESRTGSREYKAWAEMLSRCRNPDRECYKNYGGRGIKVCDRWLSFENFLHDMGRKPSVKHSLDRFPNNDGDYEPGNCRWATKKEQDTNRRQTRLLELNGKTMCLKDWARSVGMSDCLLSDRLAKGWTLKTALATPVKKYKRRTK